MPLMWPVFTLLVASSGSVGLVHVVFLF